MTIPTLQRFVNTDAEEVMVRDGEGEWCRWADVQVLLTEARATIAEQRAELDELHDYLTHEGL
jgi:hypothetical protein